MTLNNNKLTLDQEETKRLCESFVNKFNADDIIYQASNIAEIKHIDPEYFHEIFSRYTQENLQKIKKIKLDRTICSRKLEKNINNVFATIKRINSWVGDEKVFLTDLYNDKIKKRLIKSIAGFFVAIAIFCFKSYINTSYSLLLFDLSAFYVFLQIFCALIYYHGLKKVDRDR